MLDNSLPDWMKNPSLQPGWFKEELEKYEFEIDWIEEDGTAKIKFSELRFDIKPIPGSDSSDAYEYDYEITKRSGPFMVSVTIGELCVTKGEQFSRWVSQMHDVRKRSDDCILPKILMKLKKIADNEQRFSPKVNHRAVTWELLIYLSLSGGHNTRSTLARRLGVSATSISAKTRKMIEWHLIKRDTRNGYVTTPRFNQIVEKLENEEEDFRKAKARITANEDHDPGDEEKRP